MGTKEKDVRNKKKIKVIKKFIIFAIVIAYIIMFSYTFFTERVDTVPLTKGTIEKVEVAEAIITRSEKIKTSKIAGVLSPIIRAGERVSAGEKVAVVKNEATMDIEKSINELNSKVDKLVVPTVFSNDAKLLDNEVNSILLNLMQDEYYKSFYHLNNYTDTINEKLQKKAQIVGELSPKGSAERNYANQVKVYEEKRNSVESEIIAPIAGTVTYNLDGFESILTPEAIPTYTEESLNKLNIPKGELIGTVKQNSLKIVDNIECYITIMSSTKEALNARVDQKVRIRFPEISKENITGKIDYVTVENGKAVITLRINREIEKLINYRRTKVEIIWDSETGFKVPINTILNKDNKAKIFILVGTSYVVEEEVNIVDTWNDEAIIEAVEGSRLNMYDSIILNIDNVNVNKLIVK